MLFLKFRMNAHNFPYIHLRVFPYARNPNASVTQSRKLLAGLIMKVFILLSSKGNYPSLPTSFRNVKIAFVLLLWLQLSKSLPKEAARFVYQ